MDSKAQTHTPCPWGGENFESNNYFWGYLRNSLEWGIATYHENPMAQQFIDHAIQARFDTWFKPYAQNSFGRGGVAGEGWQYGLYKIGYPVIPFVSTETYGRALYDETNFYKESLFLNIYSTTPGKTRLMGTTNDYFEMFPFGDDEFFRYGASAESAMLGAAMTTYAQRWSHLDSGKYARAWVDLVQPALPRHVTALDFNTATSALPLGNLPTDYYAAGAGYLYTKNQWGADATAIHPQMGQPGAVGQYHNDSGTFQIWRKGRWLSRETTTYTDSITGYASGPSIDGRVGVGHNGILMNGVGPLNWDSANGGPRLIHWSPLNGVQWQSPRENNPDGLPTVLRVESRNDFSYAAVDLSRAYRAKNSEDPGRYDVPFSEKIVREFVFVRPLETLVILDRLEATSSEVQKTFVVHFENQPVIEDANHVLGVNGDQALRLTTLHPANHAYTMVTEGGAVGQYRIEDTTSGQTETHFLHVLQARDAAAANLTASVSQSDSTFTVTLIHPTLGQAVVEFQKGMDSIGGGIGYAATGTASVSQTLIDRIQAMTVTDFGPVWDATLDNSIKSSAGTVFTGAVNGNRAELSQVVGEAQFASTTYETAQTVNEHRIFGLKPGMQLDVTRADLGTQQQFTITYGSAFTADSNGVIAFQVLNGNVVAQ